jgi:hypothetical protein
MGFLDLSGESVLEVLLVGLNHLHLGEYLGDGVNGKLMSPRSDKLQLSEDLVDGEVVERFGAGPSVVFELILGPVYFDPRHFYNIPFIAS